ncbi:MULTISPECIES: anti-phage dCTP deaminase [unclassified Maridesulfovibrio]|uniref:anti-phage dCTP deaminase n=1 Tax=unclassified Maridesulfovibrio TaxID=2794999 RepID=UPI003B3F4A99
MNKDSSAKKIKQLGKGTTSSNKQFPSINNKIESRKRKDLVISVCGQLGSGTSTVAKEVERIFTDYRYTPYQIKLSKIIEENIATNENYKNKAERISKLQEAGNKLRQDHSESILTEFAVVKAHYYREGIGTNRDEEDDRFVIIIDSIKHPSEHELLKLVYGKSFFQIGVLCPEGDRKQRLMNNSEVSPQEATALIEKDKNEIDDFGQKTLESLYKSDFFIYNEKNNLTSTRKKLKRFIKLVMSNKTNTPTVDEYAMFLAQGSSLRSGCLSRQVGAVIIDEEGEIISTGRNDVPKYRGGLYSEDDHGNDNRCLHRYSSECKNSEYKEKIKNEISLSVKTETNKLCKNSGLSELTQKQIEQTAKTIIDNISSIDKIKNLTEFSRSIHAEMDAITAAARKGKRGLKNARLFCTTYPCHNCARHIVASGIKSVHYIEPYEKSLALKLHDDSIEFDSDYSNKGDKLKIIPFEGVSPNRYLELFEANGRKDNPEHTNQKKEKALPAITHLKDNVEFYEQVVLEDMVSKKLIPDPNS